MIPVLPAAIADLLDDATPASEPATNEEVDAFLDKHAEASRPEILAGWTKALGNHFAAHASRHVSTLSVLTGALKEARAGYFTAWAAVDAVRPLFLKEVAKPPTSKHQSAARHGQTAMREFYRILSWAIAQANAADLDEVRARTEKQMPDNVQIVDAASFFAANGQAGAASQATTGSARKTYHADFWEATEKLGRIRDFARSRRVGPFGVLGPAMTRVVATIPPTVQIPPYVGYRASLNLFVGLVGPSGKGKGGAAGAARDAVATAYVYATGPGSGEGINHLFAHYDKGNAKNGGSGTVFHRRAVYFSVPEVDTLAGLDKRNGSTLLSQVCKAWSGEDLTFAYVDRVKALVIPEHSYRLCMVVGVQPGRAGTLLDASDAGVPQRFLWLPTNDPDMPDVRPPEPAPIDCVEVAKYWPDFDKPVRLLDLPPAAEAQIDLNRVRDSRGLSTDATLDGHLGLCRIKVAIALMLLHDKPWEITDEYWELAGEVMAVSKETRDSVEAQRQAQEVKQTQHRGKLDGIRSVEADTVRTTVAVKRVANSIVRRLRRGVASRGVVRKAVYSPDRSTSPRRWSV